LQVNLTASSQKAVAEWKYSFQIYTQFGKTKKFADCRAKHIKESKKFGPTAIPISNRKTKRGVDWTYRISRRSSVAEDQR